MPAVRVALVDDHRFLAQTLAVALQDAGYEAVLVDPADDVVRRVGQWQAAVVLLDLGLAGAEGAVDGDELIPALAARHGVVVLTAETDRARWGRCLLAGARGVLSKSVPLEDIVQAVARAARGEPVGDETTRAGLLRAADRERADRREQLAPFRRLTPREEQVLAALLEGEAAGAIAAREVVSEATVRSHIRSVLLKLGVASQLQAVARARRAGWQRSPH